MCRYVPFCRVTAMHIPLGSEPDVPEYVGTQSHYIAQAHTVRGPPCICSKRLGPAWTRHAPITWLEPMLPRPTLHSLLHFDPSHTPQHTRIPQVHPSRRPHNATNCPSDKSRKYIPAADPTSRTQPYPPLVDPDPGPTPQPSSKQYLPSMPACQLPPNQLLDTLPACPP